MANQISINVTDNIPAINQATIDSDGKLGNTYSKSQLDLIIASGIKGLANTFSSPTAWTAGDPYLFESWKVVEAGTYANFKDSNNNAIIVTSADLAGNITTIDVTNGVATKNITALPSVRFHTIDTENSVIKNAFPKVELDGLWRGEGLYIETLAYTPFNNKLSLTIKNKRNEIVWFVAGLTTILGVNKISISSPLINGYIYFDTTNMPTFQQVVNFPIIEGSVVDISERQNIESVNKYDVLATKSSISLENKILVTDETQVTDSLYSITDFIPAKKGMRIGYVGKNNANSTYYDVAHVYDKFGVVVQKINRGAINGIYEFEITADNAASLRTVVENAYKDDFKLINLRSISKPEKSDYETIPASLLTGSGVAFDGSIIENPAWNRTGLLKVKPNSEIGYNGYLSNYYSIALYDANGRFIKPVLRSQLSDANIKNGTFETTSETMFIQATVQNDRLFRLFYVRKNSENIFPTVFQGYKNGENFKLTNGIEFYQQKEILDSWEKSIEMNAHERLYHNFLIANRNFFTLKNQAKIIDIKTVLKKGVLYGVQVAGSTHTISISKDSGVSYSDLFSITDSRIGEVIVNTAKEVNGVLFLRARMKTESLSYAEEVIYRAEKTDGTWNLSEVLTLPYGGVGTYKTFEFNWGFSYHKNIVVVNDYGTQGATGKIWLSQDFGKTFTKILDIYQAPHNLYMSNGHVHGSSYDPIFNRIWASTGDGYTNTYVLWSDDLGATWNKVQAPFKDENGQIHQHTQFVGILTGNDFVLFNHDSPRSGLYRYNRGKKSDTPIFEWAADVTDHSKNEIAKPTQYSGTAMQYEDGVYYAAMGWHDSAVADTGVLGKIIVSKDGYNWEVFYQDKINPVTNRGYLTANSNLIINRENVMFSTENEKWVILDKPIF